MIANTRPLAVGALACRDCGQQVKWPTAVHQEWAADRVVLMGGHEVVRRLDSPLAFSFTRCDRCTPRYERSADILAKHPAFRRSIGAKAYALEALDAALIVFDVLKVKPKDVDRMLASERDLRLVLAHLAQAGAAARWIASFLPVMKLGADDRYHATRRWAALSGRQRQDLVDAYGELLAARLDGPHRVGLPEDAEVLGCLLCGIGTVSVESTAEREPWGELRRVKARLVGGASRPEYVRGYVCRDCRPATRTAGSVGSTALELALFAFLGVRPRLDGTQIVGVKAFAGLPLGTPPNVKPWAHVDDLKGLAAGIRAA